MHANWGKATTTGGAGNLTLAPIAGFPTPWQCSGGRLFPYVAVNAYDQPLEAGWGYVMADTITFVRTRVTATYSGGTVAQGNLSASTLPSGTRIECAAHAGSIEAMLPTVDNTAGVGRMLTSAHRAATTASHSGVALRIHYLPFLLRCPALVNSLGVNVTTAASAGAQALMAVHALTASGSIGDRIPGLVTAQAIDVSTTGFKLEAVTTPQVLAAGWYVVAFVNSGSGLVLAGHPTTSATLIGGSPLGFNGTVNSPIEYRYQDVGSLSLPTTPGTTTVSVVGNAAGPMPFIGVE